PQRTPDGLVFLSRYRSLIIAALDGPGKIAIDAGARLAREPSVTEVFIEGHADSIGTSDYNLGLFLRRAETVWRRLIAGGVSAI
ncbi:MAG: OmpA family protein, partial [Alphaproteobacteria bacterium]